MSWGRIYLCIDTWNSDQSRQGYTQKPILLRFWEKFHSQFCYSPTTLSLASRNSILKKDDKVGKKLDIEEKGKKRKKENKKEGSKKDSQKKNAHARAPKVIAEYYLNFSHCHATSSWRKRGPKKKGWQRNWGFVATNIPYFKAKILFQL